MPGASVLHYLPEFAQTQVHWVMMLSNHLMLHDSLLLLLSVFTSIRVFPMSWPFASGGQSIGALVSASVLSMNIQGWFALELMGLISLLSKGLSRICGAGENWKHQFFGIQPSLLSNSHICTWLLKKNIALTIQTFVAYLRLLIFLEACKTIYNVLLGNKTIHLRVIFPWNRNVLHLYRIKSAC